MNGKRRIQEVKNLRSNWGTYDHKMTTENAGNTQKKIQAGE